MGATVEVVEVVDVVEDVVLVEVLVDVLEDGATLLDVVVDGLDVDLVVVVLGALVESLDEHAAIVSATRMATPRTVRCLTRE